MTTIRASQFLGPWILMWRTLLLISKLTAVFSRIAFLYILHQENQFPGSDQPHISIQAFCSLIHFSSSWQRPFPVSSWLRYCALLLHRGSQNTSTLVASLEHYSHPDDKMEKSHKNYVWKLLGISYLQNVRSELLDQLPYYLMRERKPKDLKWITWDHKTSRWHTQNSTRNCLLIDPVLFCAVLCLAAQSCLTLFNPMDCSPPGYSFSVAGDSPGKNTGVGCHALIQGIFPTLGLNPDLPHCRWFLYCPSHQGSTGILEGVVYPFSRWSSWPRNQTRLSCIAGRFFTSWATREAMLS